MALSKSGPLSSSDENASPAEYSDKEWYHGEMTKDKAEGQLRACGNSCFLVRESKGALILSFLLNGEAHHFNIECGSGFYRLQASSSQEKFSELTELVAHCYSNAIKITLGVACKKSHITSGAVGKNDMKAGDEDMPDGLYTKGKPADLTKYKWYHEGMVEEEARQVLFSYYEDKNRFLVRQSAEDLILSKRISGFISHTTITSSPEGYCLEGRSDFFRSIPEIIEHYSMFPIEGNQILGTACDREFSRELLSMPDADCNRNLIFKEKMSQFTVSWRSCADLPVAMSTPQVVRIGSYIYVGGGQRSNKGGRNHIIFRYSLSKDTWTPLSRCPTYYHGLATLNGELFIIGGKGDSGITNKLYTFMDDTSWKEILHPMPTPRYYLSTISYDDQLIIAAGGIVHKHSDGELILTDIVEVYNYKERQWYTTTRLLFPACVFTTSIIGDKCYILGGTGESLHTTLYTTLSSLLDNAEPADSVYSMPQVPVTWEKLQGEYPLRCPSNIVEVNQMLTTVGGADISGKETTFMSTYNVHTDTWVECKGAELPVALFSSSVVKLNDNEVMVIGGETMQDHESVQVFIGTIN